MKTHFTYLMYLFLLPLLLLTACADSPSEEIVDAEYAGAEPDVVTEVPALAYFTCKPAENGRPDFPISEIFLVLDEEAHFLTRTVNCEEVIESDDYDEYQIPADAVSAMRGKWQERDSYFYVTREDDRLVVYQRVADPNLPPSSPTDTSAVFDQGFQPIAVWRDGKLNVRVD